MRTFKRVAMTIAAGLALFQLSCTVPTFGTREVGFGGGFNPFGPATRSAAIEGALGFVTNETGSTLAQVFPISEVTSIFWTDGILELSCFFTNPISGPGGPNACNDGQFQAPADLAYGL